MSLPLVADEHDEEPPVEDVHWTGAVDTDFGNPGNWDPAVVPGPFHRAVFTFGTTATIPDGSGIQIAGLLFDSAEPVTIDGINQDNRLGINFRAGITVAQGTHTIAGSKAGGTNGGLRLMGARNRHIEIVGGASLTLDVRIRHNISGLSGDLGSPDGSIAREFFKRGGGDLILTADNGGSSSWNFSDGLFTVEEGALVMTHQRSTGLGGNNFAVSDGGTLEVRSGFQLAGGTLSLSGHGAGGAGAFLSTGSGGTVTSHATGNIVLTGDTTIGVEGDMLVMNRAIAETGGRRVLTKAGDGVLIMDPAPGHTYSGGSVVLDGLVVAASERALGGGPVFVEGGLLRLQENLDLSGGGGDDFYGLVWYPSEGDATVSSLRIHEGFDGAELARADWGGLFPDFASGGQNGLGDTYRLEASGTYDAEGALTLSFSLTDAQGDTDTVTAVIENPIHGEWFGIGGALESTYAREFDFHNLSVSSGDGPLLEMDFGSGAGKEDGSNLFIDRPGDFSGQADAIRYQATASTLTAGSARAQAANYQPGQDFFLEAEMTLVKLDWPGENRVGFAVLASPAGAVENRIYLAGGELELAEGLDFSSVRSVSPAGYGSVAGLLDGSAPVDRTALFADWSAGTGAYFSDILHLDIDVPDVAVTDPEMPGAPVSGWLFEWDYADAFGNNDGTPSGSPWFSSDVPDALSGSYAIELADGDFVRYGLPQDLRMTETLTAAAWVRTTQNAANRYVLGRWNTDNNSRAWAMLVDGGQFRVLLSEDGTFNTSNSTIHHSSFTIDDGEWHHLAFTWNAGELTLYVNGRELTDIDLVVVRDPGFTTLSDPEDATVVVGRRNDGNVGTSQFIGSIAEAAIWDGALAPEEIAWLAESSIAGISQTEPARAAAAAEAHPPYVLAIDYAPGFSDEVIDGLSVYFRDPSGSEFERLGTDLVGTDTPWTDAYSEVGQYGIDRTTRTVWVVTDNYSGSFAIDSTTGATPGQSYDAWADAEGIPADERDPALDRFGRGVPNLVSYVTGISASDPQAPSIEKNLVDGVMTFQLPVRTGIVNAGFFVSVSRDLVDWEEATGIDWDSSAIEDGRLLMDGSLPVDLDEEERIFFRIEFWLNE